MNRPEDTVEFPTPESEHPASIGAYTIERLLAHGRAACIYQAASPKSDNRQCVLKVLRKKNSHRLADWFAALASVMDRLDHPNILPCESFRSTEECDYIVMPFVEGNNLCETVVSNGALEPARLAPIIAATAEAIDYAHGRGVVHGDLPIEVAPVVRRQLDTAEYLPIVPRAGEIGFVHRCVGEEVPLLDEAGFLADVDLVSVLGRVADSVTERQIEDPGVVSPDGRLLAGVGQRDAGIEQFVGHEHPVGVVDPGLVSAFQHLRKLVRFQLHTVLERAPFLGVDVHQDDRRDTVAFGLDADIPV
ncbi:MAG: protein kinase [Acidobacteria bacterium]|nr:protein kinase [Acidobacteriota bacterium]